MKTEEEIKQLEWVIVSLLGENRGNGLTKTELLNQTIEVVATSTRPVNQDNFDRARSSLHQFGSIYLEEGRFYTR